MDQLNSSLARVKVAREVDLTLDDDQEMIEEESGNTTLEGTHFYFYS